MKSTIDVLTEARELIRDPLAHTTNTMARDAAGRPVDADSKDAVSYCAVGAAFHVSYIGSFYLDLLNDEACEMGFGIASLANDVGGHGIAMLMFDRAIRKLGGK